MYHSALIYPAREAVDMRSAYHLHPRRKIKGMREDKAGPLFYLSNTCPVHLYSTHITKTVM